MSRSPKQRGYVLLLMMAVMGTAAVGLMGATASKTLQESKSERNIKVLSQLKRIKQKLLAYSASYPEFKFSYSGSIVSHGPGYFPCPTNLADARATGNSCGSSDVIVGWLPLEIDSDGGPDSDNQGVTFRADGLSWRRVWFVLDRRFSPAASYATCDGFTKKVTNGRCTPLNSKIEPDRIIFNGDDGYVGLLIYAGRSQGGQARSDAASPDIADYLEGENADGDFEFSSKAEDSNDIIMPITRADWLSVVLPSVSYHARRNNWCSSPSDWFADNEWTCPIIK